MFPVVYMKFASKSRNPFMNNSIDLLTIAFPCNLSLSLCGPV